MSSLALGESIPQDTAHAVSVSLPTWQSNIGYEEGEKWVVEKMATGYPRFFIHKSIQAFASDIVSAYGLTDEQAMLFPTRAAAQRCINFVTNTQPNYLQKLNIVELILDICKTRSPLLKKLAPTVSALLLPKAVFPLAKQYWQHTGDGISSRRAELCHSLLKDGLLTPIKLTHISSEASSKASRGPKRYQRPGNNGDSKDLQGHKYEESLESSRFIEERFGRNLDLAFAERAKSAIRRRIAGCLVQDMDSLPAMSSNSRGLQNLHEDDVFLFPAGMNAIFNAHRALLCARGQMKSVNFGFPYVDTLKILQKFGPGCEFFGHASSADLDKFEELLRTGHRFLALFCEFPGNPLLICPDLQRIRRLANEFDFAIVVDETIGTFANINVLPAADIVVSSLTKIFSGDSNVMGGSAILNPKGRFYEQIKKAMKCTYEDTYWPEDAIFMERNSRDFLNRVDRVNTNAEAICATLQQHASVKEIFYPKYNPSKHHYDEFRLPNRGYGGLLSIVFHSRKQAETFYDSMEIAKGPSLGTNFTLCSPYVLLAHYQELSWAAQFGVAEDLVRVSVGLEDTEVLRNTFKSALNATEKIPKVD
ncbi:cystathionine gamma-synthase [Metarhizium album ARSEF 1941]|uniref:cystathionine gamma-synthase n=1 Tax=Metarhizium album (strain ARSEF 1941) TaxID=1081103 RepID=A0A0B2X6L7_METAS|nr:cystathionine gamma-synthase [Metarhizium album ARSEF 1941]KHO01115.1 cystathionine gamma-synthase [Metarhizium album ARSEF 1941]